MEHGNLHTTVFYSPGDLTAMLDIKESTLRKYANQLEKAGWHFGKNDQGHRQYNDKDVMAIRRLISTKLNTGMTLEQTANAIVPILNEEYGTVPAIQKEVTQEQYDSDITEIKELLTMQTRVIEELTKRLEERDTYIEKRLNDRDSVLLESIRTLQKQKEEENNEVRKLIAATIEEKESYQNKSWIQRLFGK